MTTTEIIGSDPGDDYVSPVSWESGLPSTLDDDYVGVMRDEAFDTGTDELTVAVSNLNGFSITLRSGEAGDSIGATAFDGTPGSGPRVQNDKGTGWGMLRFDVDATFKHFELSANGSTTGRRIVRCGGAGISVDLIGMRMGDANCTQVADALSTPTQVRLINCLVVDYRGKGVAEGAEWKAYYCSFLRDQPISNSNDGIAMRYGETINCAAAGCGPSGGWRNYLNLPAGSSNNASDDNTGDITSQVYTDMWTDPENDDFTAIASGPLDGAGTPITSITTVDILGNTRDGTNPTIGAYEIVAGGPTQKNGTDTLLPRIDDGSTLLALLQRSETLLPMLTEAASISAAPTAADSILPRIDDASTLLASSDRADTLLPRIDDASGLAVAFSTGDALTPRLDDASTVLALLQRADTLLPLLAEAASIAATLGAADALAPRLDEAADLLALLQRADTLTPRPDDSSTVAVVFNPSDTLLPRIDDAGTVTPLTTVIGASDSVLVQLAGIGAVAAALQRADALAPRLDEATTLVAAMLRGDSLLPLLADVSDLLKARAVADTLLPLLTEAATVTPVAAENLKLVLGSISILPALDATAQVRPAALGAAEIRPAVGGRAAIDPRD